MDVGEGAGETEPEGLFEGDIVVEKYSKKFAALQEVVIDLSLKIPNE